MTIQDVIDLGNPGFGFAEALGRKLALGTALAGREDTVTVSAGAGVLDFPALLVETVWNDTDSSPMVLLPAGETPASGQVAIAADRVTLAFNAAQNGKDVKVRYLPLAVLPTATFQP